MCASAKENLCSSIESQFCLFLLILLTPPSVTGTKSLMQVEPVPEVRDIKWNNAHVSKSLISTRKAWLNVALTGGLLLWSFLVSLIRGYNDVSAWFDFALPRAVAAFLDVYVPALLVEILVRSLPLLFRAVVQWTRMRTISAIDKYVLLWYFAYRLMTFIFVIVGSNLVDKTGDLVGDPVGLIRAISNNVAANAWFFCTYILVTGGLQIFFRLSQVREAAAVVYTKLFCEKAWKTS